MRLDWTRAAALAATFLVTAWGCGSASEHPETVPVQGKVTYKGAPVPKGTISFLSDGGDVAIGEIQPDGYYKLSSFGEGDGAVPGHAKVSIVANTGDPHMIPGSSPGYVNPKTWCPRSTTSPRPRGWRPPSPRMARPTISTWSEGPSPSPQEGDGDIRRSRSGLRGLGKFLSPRRGRWDSHSSPSLAPSPGILQWRAAPTKSAGPPPPFPPGGS